VLKKKFCRNFGNSGIMEIGRQRRLQLWTFSKGPPTEVNFGHFRAALGGVCNSGCAKLNSVRETPYDVKLVEEFVAKAARDDAHAYLAVIQQSYLERREELALKP
jgi:hypothetical protein